MSQNYRDKKLGQPYQGPGGGERKHGNKPLADSRLLWLLHYHHRIFRTSIVQKMYKKNSIWRMPRI